MTDKCSYRHREKKKKTRYCILANNFPQIFKILSHKARRLVKPVRNLAKIRHNVLFNNKLLWDP